jgi:hypothetical protein
MKLSFLLQNEGKMITTDISVDKNSIAIGFEGYGEKNVCPPHGTPIFIEFHENELKLYVWGDIHSEDPTHIISLEKAREDLIDKPDCLTVE